MDRHARDVSAIAEQVKSFYERKEPFRINHGSTNSTRQTLLQRKNTIDVSHLEWVLDVNVQQKTILVEPNVPMDRLVDVTLKYGLVPPVVMEFPGITVGGGCAGTSGESSSFRHGFFDRTVNFVEIVLADGSIVRASRTERSDLFDGAAGACGTLGITTLIEIQLVEAKTYVKTTYHPVTSMQAAVDEVQRCLQSDEPADYIDGIVFSKNHGAIITGQLTNEQPDRPIQRFGRAWDPWFFPHVQNLTQNRQAPITEFVPLVDYLFRYDRGGFWVGYSGFQYFYTPFNTLTRWLLDDFMRTRMLYAARQGGRLVQPYIVQDLAFPFSSAVEFMKYNDETLHIYPLWLCPLRQSSGPTFHPHNSRERDTATGALKPLLNIGLWGWGPRNLFDFIAANRQIEYVLRKLGGTKWLYAQTYYTEPEFWDVYDKASYDALRAKYRATSLPSVFEKVSVDQEAEVRAIRGSWKLWLLSLWPFMGLWALWKAMWSGEWVLAKRSRWQSIEEKDRVGKMESGVFVGRL